MFWERIKKQREEKYLSRQRELEQREQLHKEIDGRLKKVHDKYGVNTKPESDADFEDKVQDCLDVVKTQKKVYTAENKALQVMLDIEQEENKEKEREKLQQILRSLEIKRQKKDDQLLFGESGKYNLHL
ncbi:hypothetical protein AM593_08448, partial [Mytilus galloprovincialis]